MASSTLKKTRRVQFFDVTVPSGSASYDYSNDMPSDYRAANRLGAISIGGSAGLITQLGNTKLYFSNVLSSGMVVRISYFVD